MSSDIAISIFATKLHQVTSSLKLRHAAEAVLVDDIGSHGFGFRDAGTEPAEATEGWLDVY